MRWTDKAILHFLFFYLKFECAHVAQVAEHILGKNEVRSASLRVGSSIDILIGDD